MINNKEMGVFIDKNDDNDIELFNDAYKEIDYIVETSESIKFTSIPEEIKLKKRETEVQSEKKDFSNSKLLTTKEISQITGISSRKVNAWFVDNKLMYKKEDDWISTKKGKEVGSVSKEGQYGKFVVWPEEFTTKIEE